MIMHADSCGAFPALARVALHARTAWRRLLWFGLHSLQAGLPVTTWLKNTRREPRAEEREVLLLQKACAASPKCSAAVHEETTVPELRLDSLLPPLLAKTCPYVLHVGVQTYTA